jgi:GT2 family glycosyltransferase
MNQGAADARGSSLLFLTDDCLVDEPATLTTLAGMCRRPEVGVVAATTRFINGAVRSNGLSIGLKSSGELYVTHLNRYLPKGNLSYLNQILLDRDARALAPTGLVVDATLFSQLEGFDESYATSDVSVMDLCLRARAAGFAVIQSANATVIDTSPLAYDDESGIGVTDALRQDRDLLAKKHCETLQTQDPCYNTHFNTGNGFYQLKK